MKLLDIRKALNILNIVYKAREVKPLELKIKVYTMVKRLNKDLMDSVDSIYKIYESYGLKDSNGTIVKLEYDISDHMKPIEYTCKKEYKKQGYDNKKVYEDVTETYYKLPVKTFESSCTFLLKKDDITKTDEMVSKILDIDFDIKPVEINILELMQSNLSGLEIDNLLNLGVFKLIQ